MRRAVQLAIDNAWSFVVLPERVYLNSHSARPRAGASAAPAEPMSEANSGVSEKMVLDQHISLNFTLDALEDWNSVLHAQLGPYVSVIIDEISSRPTDFGGP
jgi:hypothetical protein